MQAVARRVADVVEYIHRARYRAENEYRQERAHEHRRLKHLSGEKYRGDDKQIFYPLERAHEDDVRQHGKEYAYKNRRRIVENIGAADEPRVARMPEARDGDEFRADVESEQDVGKRFVTDDDEPRALVDKFLQHAPARLAMN